MEDDINATRRRWLKLTGTSLAGASLSGTAHASSNDEEVVFVHPKGNGADVAAAAQANNGRVVYDYENFDFIAVRIPSNQRPNFEQNSRVSLVESDEVVYPARQVSGQAKGTGRGKGRDIREDQTERSPQISVDDPTGADLATSTSALSVSTRGTKLIDSDSAILYGELTSLGGGSEVTVYFDARSVGSHQWVTVGEQTLSAPGEFKQGVRFQSDTDYEFRAVATSTDWAARGSVVTLNPAQRTASPAATTLDETIVDPDSAVLHGELTDLGSASSVDVHFEIREPSWSNWVVVGEQTLNSTGTFKQRVKLAKRTEYEFRVVATSTDGSLTGQTVAFTTSDAFPSVSTLAPTAVDSDSAVLHGNLTDLGSANVASVDTYFEARSVRASEWTVVGKQTLDLPGEFEQAVRLNAGTEYEFRAVAENTHGSRRGDIRSFTTESTQVPSWGHTRVFGNSSAAKDATYNTATGAGVDIAVLDTGIQQDHPDIAANVAGGVQITSDGDGWDDKDGHGTHCAGIAGAVDNNIGTLGVAPEANLWAVKVFHEGSGSLSDVIAGIDWSISHEKEIISMSFTTTAKYSLTLAIEEAVEKGHLLIAAAGNGGTDGDGSCSDESVGFPALHKDVVAVSAMNSDETVASYSNVGSGVELMAPGSHINGPTPTDDYMKRSGTSMACPMVSGTAALAWEVLGASGPDTTHRDRIRTALGNNAESVLGTCEAGNGLVRPDRVINALET